MMSLDEKGRASASKIQRFLKCHVARALVGQSQNFVLIASGTSASGPTSRTGFNTSSATMASAFSLSSLAKNPGEALIDSNTTFLYFLALCFPCIADCRTWESILSALQHPTYTAPSLKATLLSRIAKLQNISQAFPLKRENTSTVGDSITIDGVKYDVTTQQKDLVDKVAKEAQLDTIEAFKIVTQQSKLGIYELDSIIKAYMRERTAILRVVKCLLRLDLHNDSNAKTRLLAKEIVSKVKGDKDFVPKLLQGIEERVSQQLPTNITSDPQYASIWSRQVRLLLDLSDV